MVAQRKIFRIEENFHVGIVDPMPAISADDEAARRHHELMTEIMSMRVTLNARALQGQSAPHETLPKPHEHIVPHVSKEQIAHAHELKGELDLIHEAIRRTKQDIGGFEVGTFFGPQMARVGQELDAVVTGTEQATQKILKSAEDIDQIANSMSSLLKGEYAHGLAQDVRDHVMRIFEACNFQDLTGQRISKVVTTLKFIEDHIDRMQEIWKGIENVAPSTPATPRKGNDESSLINGPKLDSDSGHASQADIDVIFDSN